MQPTRKKSVDRWGVGTAALVEEIARVAERLRVAQASRQRKRQGATPATARLLRVVASSNRYLAIADAARLMRMTRQAARELVLRAAAEGELLVGLSLRELDTTLGVLREVRDRLVRFEDRGRRVSRR
jgi:hypothetical protein